MDQANAKKLPQYISVEYPSRKINDNERMFETLGGRQKVAQAIYNSAKLKLPLELRMRPHDMTCKPIYGSPCNIAGVIIKFKIKKKTKEVISYETLGYAIKEYSFTRLSDFQLIPHINGKDIYEDICPINLNLDWLDKKTGPGLIVPPAFIKNNSLTNYFFSNEKPSEVNLIGSTRKKRSGLAIFCTFEDDEVPIVPKSIDDANITEQIRIFNDDLTTLKTIFEERPIYSKSAIFGTSRIKMVTLKLLLPMVAYHFSNGPWRALWVRLGYDPRADPSSKIYQTLDFRLESKLHDVVALKRTQINRRKEKEKRPRGEDVSPVEYRFVPGIVPPYRQFFYQYCDILIPEVQAIMETTETLNTCDSLTGWFPPGTSTSCRVIMNRYINEEIRRRKEVMKGEPSGSQQEILVDIPEAPTSSSDDDVDDDDDEIDENFDSDSGLINEDDEDYDVDGDC